MNGVPRHIKARLEVAMLRAGLTLSLAASVFLGGCEMGRQEAFSLRDGPRVYAGGSAAGGGEAVFEGPEAAALTGAYGAESFPEYARLDGRMNIAVSQPMLATAQWPQQPAPDATNLYVTYLPLTTSTSYQPVPIYQPEGAYNPRAAWRRRWWY